MLISSGRPWQFAGAERASRHDDLGFGSGEMRLCLGQRLVGDERQFSDHAP